MTTSKNKKYPSPRGKRTTSPRAAAARSPSNRASNSIAAAVDAKNILPSPQRKSMRQAKKTAISSMSAAHAKKTQATKQGSSNNNNNKVEATPKKQQQRAANDNKGSAMKTKPHNSNHAMVLSSPSSKKQAAPKPASKVPPKKAASSAKKTPRKPKSPSRFTTPSPAVSKHRSKTSSSHKKKSPYQQPQYELQQQTPIVLAMVNLEQKPKSRGLQQPADNNSRKSLKRLKVVTHITLGHKSTFVVRLLAMLHHSHKHSPGVCRWVDNGAAVEMHAKHDEMGEVLAKFFQHSNFLSFQRQLNNYGFIRESDGPDVEPGHSIYYHAEFHHNSDPATIQSLIRYQGQKSPVKGSAGTPMSAATRSVATRKEDPSSAKKIADVPAKAASTSPPKKSPPNNTNSELQKESAPSPKKKRRSSSRIRKTTPKRAKVGAPAKEKAKVEPKAMANSSKLSTKKKVEVEDEFTVPSSLAAAVAMTRASSVTQFSRFHRMRKIESQVSEGSALPVATPSTTQPVTTLNSKRIVSGQINHSSLENIAAYHAISSNRNADTVAMAPHPPPFAFSVTGTPVVASRKKRDLMTLPIETPVTSNKKRDDEFVSTPHSISSPSHLAMLSAFLETPSPTKRSMNSSTPGKDGFRVLFHAAQAVEHSPMLLANAKAMASPSATIGGSLSNSAVKASPIGSMLNMDLDSFGHAMDALEQPQGA